MARHSRRHRRSRNRNSRMRGGYSSATTYGMHVNGSGSSQWARTMDQSGPYGQIPGNVIIGAQGQNMTSADRMPTAADLAKVQSGGRRRRRGGFLGEVVNQAIVPLSLLGMQQTYRRKSRGGRRTRRHRRH